MLNRLARVRGFERALAWVSGIFNRQTVNNDQGSRRQEPDTWNVMVQGVSAPNGVLSCGVCAARTLSLWGLRPVWP